MRVEQLIQEFTGKVERRLRTADELESAYARVLDAVIPGMGAEQIVDREEPQETFEMICLRSARPGAEHERVALCRAISAELVGSSHPTLIDGHMPRPPRGAAATVWMLRQLERIGKAESVARLAELLAGDDSQIRELARRALEANPADGAARALRAALESAKDADPAWQVALINALAARDDLSGVAELTLLSRSRDRDVSAAAIAALGDLGNPWTADLLHAPWRGEDDSPQEPTGPAVLRVAEWALQAGYAEQAAGIYLDLYLSSSEPSIRIAAMRGLTMARREQALPRLLAVIRGEVNPELLRHAAGFTMEIPGENVTRGLVAELSNAPVEVQVVLLDVLAGRGDQLAKPAVVEAVKNPDEAVRLAALAALRELGDHTDVMLVANAAAHADGRERETAREGLSRLRGENVDETILAGTQEHSEPKVRAELIRALGQRRFTPAVSTLLQTADDPSENVRVASFKALGELSKEGDLPELIRLAMGESSDEARESAEDAVVAVCLRLDDEQQPAAPVLAVIPGADGVGKASLVRVLGRIRGDSALEAIRVALNDREPEVVDAAVRALAKWDDVAVLDDLRGITAANSLPEHKVLALRGYVRLVRLPSEREPRETLNMLQRAMRMADRPEEKKLVLAGLSDVIELDALRMAQSHLDDEELGDEAASAVISIARPLSAKYHEESVTAAKRLLTVNIGDPVRTQVEEALDFINRRTGDIVTWLISGPYTQDGVEAADLLDTPFPPEREGANRDATVRERAHPYGTGFSDGLAADTQWRRLKITDPKDPWAFDLSEAVGGDNRCVYVTTQIWSDTSQPALLEIGSDDGVKAWLNGEVVHTNNVFRGLTAGEDTVDVTLNAGENTLLLKIVQGDGGWGFTCSVKSPEGEVLQGLRFKAE